MKRKFWQGKPVLITGFEGFLGSNLTKKLLSLDARIIGLDIKTFRTKTFLDNKERSKLKIIKGNVSNFSLVKKILKRYEIDTVFHLAAEALVQDCQNHPLKAFKTNIQGTWTILEACRKNPVVKRLVIASSDKAYGEQKRLPYRESQSLSGFHPYDVSKSCADLIAQTYFHSYGLPVCVTRCGNIYGPGDFNFSRIIPQALKAILEKKPLVIRSDGRFTRDYIYVDDIVSAYILLAEKMSELNIFGEAFNFSNEKPISVLKLVNKIYKIAVVKPDYKILKQAKLEIKDQFLSSAKAKKILSWKPIHTLDLGLKKTFKWYKKQIKI